MGGGLNHANRKFREVDGFVRFVVPVRRDPLAFIRAEITPGALELVCGLKMGTNGEATQDFRRVNGGLSGGGISRWNRFAVNVQRLIARDGGIPGTRIPGPCNSRPLISIGLQFSIWQNGGVARIML